MSALSARTLLRACFTSFEAFNIKLDNTTAVIQGARTDASKHDSRTFAGGNLAERSYVVHLDEMHRFLASPSITKLPSGRLLLLYEKQASWGFFAPETGIKYVHASDDGGKSWQHVGLPGAMQWPQIFTCASGTFIIGCERGFSNDNNILITKMTDLGGAAWSPPVKITQGFSVVTINTGVDVSRGRVTKSFEIIPSMSGLPKTSEIEEDVRILIDMQHPERPSWKYPPTAEIVVKDARGFVENTLVKIPYGGRAIFFRVLAVDLERQVVMVRLERFTLFWQATHIQIDKGSYLMVGSGANVYGGVDWVAMGMSAEEGADLLDPQAWTLSNGVGNPASLYPNEMRLLFDAAFKGDYNVRKSILGFEHSFLKEEGPDVWEAGFGSLYWMEGVTVRLQDRRGSSGLLLNVLRINNDNFCDLAALVTFDDSVPGVLKAKFLRYTNVPGLAIGHPSILYDHITDLYWMASNLNRDPMRNWKWHGGRGHPNLHMTAFSKCEVDRTTVALYYSSNGMDWLYAGIVDYHLSFGRHFTYPHMIVDNDDLLIVMRATFAPEGDDRPPPPSPNSAYYNNHNSNAISFHRVVDFRRHANVRVRLGLILTLPWATHDGPYTWRPRRMSGFA